MSRKNTKTAEQRQAEREALMQTLGEKVAALATSQAWLAYLRFVAAFRSYSVSNLLLIAAQAPHATRVAGYRTWQRLGRQVRRGEKAIKILGYSTKKITKTDPETGEETEDRLIRYPLVSVFDISQTEGDAIPTGGYQVPTGDGSVGALDQLTGWLESEDWTLREIPLAGGCEGYTDHTARTIVSDDHLDRAARLVVLLHEAAHAVLHGDLAPREYHAHRGVCETEAESAAYVLANLLGLDTDGSSISYVAGWSHADPDVLTAVAANVLRAVNTIAAGLGLDDDQKDADETNTAA
jgi:antirestriction protein ArdC